MRLHARRNRMLITLNRKVRAWSQSVVAQYQYQVAFMGKSAVVLVSDARELKFHLFEPLIYAVLTSSLFWNALGVRSEGTKCREFKLDRVLWLLRFAAAVERWSNGIFHMHRSPATRHEVPSVSSVGTIVVTLPPTYVQYPAIQLH
jgi:hypothetical protein